MYDVLIVGGGAGGLTSALYTGRKKLKTGIITIDVGGQTLLTDNIENYPGVDPMPGANLITKFKEQAEKFGSEFIFGEVDKIIKTKEGNFKLNLSNGESYESKTVILASGKTARKIGVPGEAKFLGRGVSTCATCDAAFFNKKTVAVIGGGNSALDAAILLEKFADKIYVIHRRDEFRGDEITVEKILKSKKIEKVFDSIPKEISGEKVVEKLIVENVKTNEENELKVDGVFIEIGYELKTDFVKELVEVNKIGEIIVDDRCRTSLPGFFAAGDVTTVPFKQTIISAGEGAKAGLEAYRYLQGDRANVSIDWK
ncbi:thioredoxin-disulfide reductase [archaeon]|jgi:thioredoxin-disulfide reductase|nr:thioredoxin-disulfide reductase [archaeon]